jgi:CRISPR-associated protein Csd2
MDSQPVKNRYDFILLFDVTNGNPNGDPDAGNSPRIDPETGHGLVSDVCLKRKVRNYICMAKKDPKSLEIAPGYDIYVKEKAVLNLQNDRAWKALKLNPDAKGKEKANQVSEARAWMCQTFFDVRMFGAVMTLEINCGQVRGPVQFSFARSIDPITSLEQSITRMAVATVREAEQQDWENRTMGRKEIVPYGIYVAHGFISPHLAADTGFSDQDLELFWEALEKVFEHDRSAARGLMSTQKLIIFKHESALGNAPAHSLFNRVKITRKDDAKPARDFSDYNLEIDDKNLPAGISIITKP